MEILGILGLIIGIVAGSIAIWGIIPKRKTTKKLFRKQLSSWSKSNHEYIPSHDEFRKLTKYISVTDLNNQELVFCLLCALQHGDKSMNMLIQRNLINKSAIAYIFSFLNGRGIRVGWRAEFALSNFPHEKIIEFINSIENQDELPECLHQSISRVINNDVIGYLRTISDDENHNMNTYATQVLRQIQVVAITTVE